MNFRRSYRPSVRLGKHGHPMRDPDGHDIDITSDLTGGADDGALADPAPQQRQPDSSSYTPPAGTQPKHGNDILNVNQAQPSQEQQTKAPAKEPSLREQLSSAFKGTDNKPTDQQQAQNASQPSQAPAALTRDADGKYRNPDGTFASAEQVSAFEAAQKNAQPQQGANTPPSQSPAIAGLTPVEQQQLQSLPAELRQYVERTMEGLNTRAQRYSEYDLIEQQILGPRREALMAQGSNPVIALNQLFALSDFAGRDPGNFVMWFSQQHGLDLDALLDARDAQNANVDPRVQQLEGQVQQLAGTVQQFQQRDVQAAQQANLTAVQNFAEERDASGNLLRPHLTDVMDDWATQITAIRASNPNMPNAEVLQRAYDNACWSNPTVRGRMQEAMQKQQREADAARVAAAKAAGSSVTGAPAGNASTIPNNSNRSLRDELQAQFNAARAV